MSHLIDKYDIYLTDYAKGLIDTIMAKTGLDKDLVVSILEASMTEEMMYQLPLESEDQEDKQNGTK